MTALLSSILIISEEQYPPVAPLWQNKSSPFSDFKMCQPSPSVISSFTLNVGFLVNESSLFSGLNWAFTNFVRSSVVDKIPPAANKASKSQLGITSPFGFSPFTRWLSRFLELVKELFIPYLSKTLFWSNVWKLVFCERPRAYPNNPAPKLE